MKRMIKKLTVNHDDAKIARRIFERYLALGNVANLKRELDADGIVSKERLSKRGNAIGGKPYSRGALYSILQNPIYIGKIRHKDQAYDGQHEPIIPHDIWDGVQEKLSSQAAAQRGHKKAADQNLLKGLLFDCEGTPYSPDFTNKGGKRYRYYISQNLIQYRDHPKGTMARIPAHEIERVVIDTIRNGLIDILELNQIDDHEIIEHITIAELPAEELLRSAVNKITVGQDMLHIDVSTAKLQQALQEHLNMNIPERYNKPAYVLSVPFTTRRSYKGAVILKPETAGHDPLDLPPHELRNLVKGTIWREEHFNGMTLPAIAARDGFSKQHVHQMILKSMEIGANCR